MPSSPSWNRALTLSERDLLFLPTVEPDGYDAGLAGQRLERWRVDSGLTDDARFALRLQQQQIDAARFEHLLGSPPPSAVDAFWLEELLAAYAEPRTSSEFGAMPTATAAEQDDGIFLDILRPLLDAGWNRFCTHLAALDWPTSRLDLLTFAGLWAQALPSQMLMMVSRTLVLELYIRRIEGTLAGATPEERFQSFVDGLRERSGGLELWAQYPVLARSLMVRLQQWIDVGVELAERLLADLPDLETTFGVAGDLTEVEAGLGDRHKAGRTVVQLEFSCGVRMVYKPRSLALDVVFQQLLRWLGDQGVEPRLRTLELLDRGSYGWVEFVRPAECRDEDEVRQFYARQGIFLALLYALEATDFHHENLIAAGEHPVLIDLETLFQPLFGQPGESREDFNPVASTVLRSGLLPRRSWGEMAAQDMDLSGLGASRFQQAGARELSRVGTDEMSFVDSVTEIPMGRHLPMLAGDEVPLWTMTGVILDSFEATYRQLLRLRSHFLDPGGWLDRFAGHETRIIVRPTGLYVRLLHLAYHPDHLSDSLQREQLFDKLWLDTERFAYIRPVVPFERTDLWQGDVPVFTSRTDCCDLYASGGSRMENALPKSGLELVRWRLESMSEQDLERQFALARLSLAAVHPPGPSSEDTSWTPSAYLSSGETKLVVRSREEFLNQSTRVAERLELLAFRSENWLSWFDLLPRQGVNHSLEPVGADLYAGLGGITLFLAYQGEVASQPRFTDLARAALVTGRERFDRQLRQQGGLGGFSGLGGWIYLLTCLSVLWRSPELLDEAERVRDLVAPRIDDDQGLDVIAGSAGCIAALLALHHHRPSAETLGVAQRCGDQLMRRAEAQEHGRAWRLPAVAERPLTGFAHGAAGMAWSLARLAAASGEERFADAARAGLTYERSLFSAQRGNWPDLRFDRRQGGSWGYFHAWCHGAPGIGLSRLHLLEEWAGDFWDTTQREAEIRAAVSSTQQQGFGDNHCLCHGDLGNLELLARAGRQLDDAEICRGAEQRASQILDGIEAGGFRCGISSRVDQPGLMTGLAGIGYGLLQLAAPLKVPSVLLLEPPSRV